MSATHDDRDAVALANDVATFFECEAGRPPFGKSKVSTLPAPMSGGPRKVKLTAGAVEVEIPEDDYRRLSEKAGLSGDPKTKEGIDLFVMKADSMGLKQFVAPLNRLRDAVSAGSGLTVHRPPTLTNLPAPMGQRPTSVTPEADDELASDFAAYFSARHDDGDVAAKIQAALARMTDKGRSEVLRFAEHVAGHARREEVERVDWFGGDAEPEREEK